MDDRAEINERIADRHVTRLEIGAKANELAQVRINDYNDVKTQMSTWREQGKNPAQIANLIEEKYPAKFSLLPAGTTDPKKIADHEEAIRNQFRRDAAFKIDQVMDVNGRIDARFDKSLDEFKAGKSIAGQGLAPWKRMESTLESLSEQFVRAGKYAARLADRKVMAVGAAGLAVSELSLAKTPEARAQAGVNFVKSAADMLPIPDPTGSAASSLVQVGAEKLGLVRSAGPTEFEQNMKGALSGISHGKRTDPAVLHQKNMAITREQKFLMSDQHPGQLCALTMKGADGKPLDVEAMLKNPAQRGQVMAEIDRRAATASPQSKELFAEMKQAAQEFSTLEDRRRELNPAAPQPAQPQMAVASTKPQAFAPV